MQRIFFWPLGPRFKRGLAGGKRKRTKRGPLRGGDAEIEYGKLVVIFKAIVPRPENFDFSLEQREKTLNKTLVEVGSILS